jgi:hypothetical protein
LTGTTPLRYGVYIDHIIDMAEILSTGIIQQLPARF